MSPESVAGMAPMGLGCVENAKALFWGRRGNKGWRGQNQNQNQSNLVHGNSTWPFCIAIFLSKKGKLEFCFLEWGSF